MEIGKEYLVDGKVTVFRGNSAGVLCFRDSEGNEVSTLLATPGLTILPYRPSLTLESPKVSKVKTSALK